MRILASFIIMASLSFFIPKEDHEYTNENHLALDSKYCNARFDFCTEYPDTLLPYKFISKNNDGITLQTKDEKVIVIVAGIRRVLDQDIDALFDDYVTDRLKHFEDGKIFYEEFKDNYYKTSFTDGKYHYLQKLYTLNDKNIIYQIKAPSTMSFRISEIDNHLDISLNP